MSPMMKRAMTLLATTASTGAAVAVLSVAQPKTAEACGYCWIDPNSCWGSCAPGGPDAVCNYGTQKCFDANTGQETEGPGCGSSGSCC